ncbi:MAG: hypothetical protein UY96_C0013G0008 [Parcubacteria group bacterium GW2011_GWB1_56_8]|nr:MAG: hypothetical protein UY96_C0013G0008 [Parcubacteria group bacterium GW2011_GWB1_56_8]
MKIINSFDGKKVKIGDNFEVPGYEPHKLVRIRDRFFSAQAFYCGQTALNGRWQPLAVRFTHPNFFLQRVLFIPT